MLLLEPPETMRLPPYRVQARFSLADKSGGRVVTDPEAEGQVSLQKFTKVAMTTSS
jgi:hypothetical protein